MHCQPFGLATLPRAGTPWEGKRGAEVWPCAPLLFKCAPQRTAAARRKSGSLLKTGAERAGDRDYDGSSDEAGNQITDQAAKRDSEQAEQPTRDSGPYDADKPRLSSKLTLTSIRSSRIGYLAHRVKDRSGWV